MWLAGLRAKPPTRRSRQRRAWADQSWFSATPYPSVLASVFLHHRRTVAVNVDGGTRDVGRRVRRHETRHVGEFLGATDATHGDLFAHLGEKIRKRHPKLRGTLDPLIALDEADQQRVDKNSVRCPLARQYLGQRHAGRAGHRSRRAGWARRLGADVEYVDDAAPFALFHLRPGEPDQPNGGEKLEVEVLLPLRIGDGLEGMGVGGAGVVHQDIDVAQSLRHKSKSCRNVCRVPHVAGDRQHLLPRPGPNRGHGVVQGTLPARHDRDVGAGRRKGAGNRKAQTLASAGNEGFPACQLYVHCFFSRSVRLRTTNAGTYSMLAWQTSTLNLVAQIFQVDLSFLKPELQRNMEVQNTTNSGGDCSVCSI